MSCGLSYRTISLIREGGGSWSFTIPISSREYRERNPTKARIIVSLHHNFIRFSIYDDVGELTTIDVGHGHSEWTFKMLCAAFSERLI